jgi:putative permease
MSCTNYIIFSYFGLNYKILLAVLVGLSVVVPYVGAIVVTIPVMIIGYVQWGWSSTFGYLSLWYYILQELDANMLIPLLFSEVVKVHPVAIILAILFFGKIWGFWGVFFAIPLATLIKSTLHAWPDIKKRSKAC